MMSSLRLLLQPRKAPGKQSWRTSGCMRRWRRLTGASRRSACEHVCSLLRPPAALHGSCLLQWCRLKSAKACHAQLLHTQLGQPDTIAGGFGRREQYALTARRSLSGPDLLSLTFSTLQPATCRRELVKAEVAAKRVSEDAGSGVNGGGSSVRKNSNGKGAAVAVQSSSMAAGALTPLRRSSSSEKTTAFRREHQMRKTPIHGCGMLLRPRETRRCSDRQPRSGHGRPQLDGAAFVINPEHVGLNHLQENARPSAHPHQQRLRRRSGSRDCCDASRPPALNRRVLLHLVLTRSDFGRHRMGSTCDLIHVRAVPLT